MSTVVWRIGHAAASTVDDQEAYGSTLFPGRWHTLRFGPRPRRVIYAASSRALAQLEKRVHANGVAPVNQALFALALPPDADIDNAEALGLAAHWRDDVVISQRFGDAWLDGGEGLALRVPSFVEPAEASFLLNPDHPKIGGVTLSVERNPFKFDPRLM